MKHLLLVLLAIVLSVPVLAATADSDPVALEAAKATLQAHGGEKLKAVKNMVIKGTADVTGPNTAQSIPAGFAFVFAGEKYRFDLQSPFFAFKQVYDGQTTTSSMPGMSLPPLNRVGLPLLTKIEETGYKVTPLPEKLKKKLGFRITSPEGYFADFIVDEKTSLVKEFESNYEIGDRQATTSVAIDKYKNIEGVMVNEKFSQRLDLGSFTSYASFKATEITIDTEITDDVFSTN
jgi:hypothetical protein